MYRSVVGDPCAYALNNTYIHAYDAVVKLYVGQGHIYISVRPSEDVGFPI